MSKRPTVTINGDECYINIGNYPASPLAMYIQLVLVSEEEKPAEEYAVVSKNFGNYYCEGSFVQLGTTFLDENNCGHILPTVIEALEGKPYVKWGSPVYMESGYCIYPYYEFNKAKLREYDPDGYERYIKAWQKECSKEQAKLNALMFGV